MKQNEKETNDSLIRMGELDTILNATNHQLIALGRKTKF